MHCVRVDCETYPPGHVSHAVAAVKLSRPAPDAGLLRMVRAGQRTHEVVPAVVMYVPLPQMVQVLDSVSGWKEPASHMGHAPALPVSEKRPTGH